jgi:copper ion binding protein
MKTIKTTLQVEGMSCEHCVKAVTEALKAVSGVKKAKVNLKAKKADLVHEESTTLEALKAAIIGAGFQVSAP